MALAILFTLTLYMFSSIDKIFSTLYHELTPHTQLFGKFGSIDPSLPIVREILMNNTNLTNHGKQLSTWDKIINDCNSTKASIITLKDWLKTYDISHDT